MEERPRLREMKHRMGFFPAGEVPQQKWKRGAWCEVRVARCELRGGCVAVDAHGWVRIRVAARQLGSGRGRDRSGSAGCWVVLVLVLGG